MQYMQYNVHVIKPPATDSPAIFMLDATTGATTALVEVIATGAVLNNPNVITARAFAIRIGKH